MPIPSGDSGLIAMFNTTPPSNWAVVSGSGEAFASRFLVGNTSYGGTGGAASHANPDHTSTTGGPSATTTDDAGAKSLSDDAHTHDVTVLYSTDANLPPYINVIFAHATSIITKGIVPMGSGTPFYTTDQNPMDPATTACLANMSAGDGCNVTWSVNATGDINSTW